MIAAEHLRAERVDEIGAQLTQGTPALYPRLTSGRHRGMVARLVVPVLLVLALAGQAPAVDTAPAGQAPTDGAAAAAAVPAPGALGTKAEEPCGCMGGGNCCGGGAASAAPVPSADAPAKPASCNCGAKRGRSAAGER